MYFHLISNLECNSECRYCYKRSIEDFGNDLNDRFKFDFVPQRPEYSIGDLRNFIKRSKSKEKHVLTFYGGEPLLDLDWLRHVIDCVDARFMLQTNGKLLDKLEKKYVNKFEVILVSLDGDKDITDFNRGEGTYDLVVKNLHRIKENGFKGELIARMVVDEHNDLVKSTKHLFAMGFNAVHWQLDAAFFAHDYEKRDFKTFCEKYNTEVRQLAGWWMNEMKKGKVHKIYPFLGIFESLHYKKKEKLRCGCGYANYTINTKGKIAVCPTMADASAFYVGDIAKDSPDDLDKVYVGGDCKTCDIKGLCGGRCLYANKAELWPKEGQDLICGTVRNLIDTIKEKLPLIRTYLQKKIVFEEDFFYERYNGTEIIP